MSASAERRSGANGRRQAVEPAEMPVQMPTRTASYNHQVGNAAARGIAQTFPVVPADISAAEGYVLGAQRTAQADHKRPHAVVG